MNAFLVMFDIFAASIIKSSQQSSTQQQFSHSATPFRNKQQQVKVTSGIVNVEAQVGLNFGVKI